MMFSEELRRIELLRGLSDPVRKTVSEIAFALENGEVERLLLARKLLAISREGSDGILDRTQRAS